MRTALDERREAVGRVVDELRAIRKAHTNTVKALHSAVASFLVTEDDLAGSLEEALCRYHPETLTLLSNLHYLEGHLDEVTDYEWEANDIEEAFAAWLKAEGAVAA